MSPKQVARKPRANDVAIYAAFFASGTAGLIYEISWSRQIGLLFGHTVHASAIVIACFFTGMAIGYALAARFIRWGPALRSYALAECLVAIWACLIPFLLDLLKLPLPAEYLHHTSFLIQTVARMGVCFFILLPATVGLGATLPFIAEYLSPENAPTPRRIAKAYAINTSGAILGVVMASAVLFLTVGVRGSNWLAAAISALSGWVVFQQSKRPDGRPPSVGKPAKALHSRKRRSTAAPQREPAFLWPGFAVLSGFATLALQILYIHLFSLVLHNSTYTFGAILVIFLGGLALGATLAQRLLMRFRVRSVMAWACLLSSLTLTLSLGLFLLSTELKYFDAGQSFAAHMTAVMTLVGIVVGPSTVLLGLILPATWYGATQHLQGSGRIVGRLTAANTLASTVGSLVAAFVFIPKIGVWPSFLIVAAVLFVSGATVIWQNGRHVLILGTGALSLCLGIGAMLGLKTISTVTAPSQAKVLKEWTTAYGRIDVVGIPEKQWFALRENLHYVHGDTAHSAAREFRQGHLPLLLHPTPKRILFLGLGTGMTAGAALKHGAVEHVTAVELIPEVVEAVPFFSQANENLLEDPRVNIAIDDARHWLLAYRQERFDVIVSDLFVPWQSKSGYLYTVEHYREVRRHLNEAGIFCQWLTFNQIGQREFEIIADSFASVFPVTTLWWGRLTPQQGMIMLVGSEARLSIDGTPLAARLETLNATTNPPDAYLRSVTYFCRLFAGRWPSPVDSAPLNTDEFPRVEFLTPLTYRRHAFLTNQSLLTYFDQTLSQLHADGVHFDLSTTEQETLVAKHGMQRDVLIRQMKGRR